MVERLESGVLASIPGYSLLRSITGELASTDDPRRLRLVLAQFDDVAQVALEVERLGDGRVVLFIPGAPDPWTGDVFVPEHLRSAELLEHHCHAHRAHPRVSPMPTSCARSV